MPLKTVCRSFAAQLSEIVKNYTARRFVSSALLVLGGAFPVVGDELSAVVLSDSMDILAVDLDAAYEIQVARPELPELDSWGRLLFGTEPEYRAPAEFERQQGLIVSWPNINILPHVINYETYRKLLTDIVKEAHTEVTVYVDVNPSSDNDAVSSLMEAGISRESFSNGKIVLHNFSAPGYLWVRDYGPFFVESEAGMQVLDFQYIDRGLAGSTSAGDSFPYEFYMDPAAPSMVGHEENPLIWEGGDFMHNGDGLILVPDAVFRANPEGGIWLTALKKFGKLMVRGRNGYGVHVDMGMKFLNNNTVLIGAAAVNDQLSDLLLQGFGELDENAMILGAINNRGKQLSVVRIPLALDTFGAPCPYTNSVILNRKVLVPVCGISADAIALDIYRDKMPGYDVVPLDYSETNTGIFGTGGAAHCLTREIPAVPSRYSPRALWPAGDIPRNTRLLVQWARVEGVNEYQVIIEKPGKFSNIVVHTVDVTIPEGHSTSIEIDWSGQPETLYSWKVAAIYRDKWKSSKWSESIVFKMSGAEVKPAYQLP